ncbi:MAG: hypothetical protein ACE5JE_04200 [Thermoplasmata archaeon]
MDSSNVLTALEELEKWRARRVKIQNRLAASRRERWTLERELEKLGRQLSGLADALFSPEERDADAHLIPPFLLGRQP